MVIGRLLWWQRQPFPFSGRREEEPGELAGRLICDNPTHRPETLPPHWWQRCGWSLQVAPSAQVLCFRFAMGRLQNLLQRSYSLETTLEQILEFMLILLVLFSFFCTVQSPYCFASLVQAKSLLAKHPWRGKPESEPNKTNEKYRGHRIEKETNRMS